GNRVETAEVEVSLLEIPGVQEAAVIHIGETDETRILIAFVASQSGLSGSELRRQLAARLPAYMVPSTIVVLEELPRNSNGKVARSLLSGMAGAFANSWHEAKVEEAPVRSDTDALVTEMVSELLGSSIGPHDNFFDVGGHSL